MLKKKVEGVTALLNDQPFTPINSEISLQCHYLLTHTDLNFPQTCQHLAPTAFNIIFRT